MRVLGLSINDASWSPVGDHEIYVSDIVDQATMPDAKMTVGSHGSPKAKRSRSRSLRRSAHPDQG